MKTRRLILAVLVLAAAAQCRSPGTEEVSPDGSSADGGPVHGGVLRIGIRSEPLTWNQLLVTDETSYQITEQLHAALVRVNRVTQEVEPELAESWSFSDDGRELSFRLRPNVVFSDGVPLTADDVLFTFQALHDPEVASPLVETALVDGEPLVPEALDSRTVRFRLKRRTAVVERIFDSIPILPRHRLEKPLAEGVFASEYGVGTSENAIVGLGPFVLERYVPGQRVMLRRNPRYWKSAEGDSLPYLDGIVYEILTDASALMLRFRGGELDILSPLSPEDFLSLKKAGRSEVRLLDLGPGTATERIWFNLNPESPVSGEKRAWFSDSRFRRAISLAIDRTAISKAVYLNLASQAAGPISPANRRWWNEAIEATPLDVQSARKLLADAAFEWDQAGALLGPGGQPVRFTLLTNADNPYRIKTAAIMQEDLAQIGVVMNLVPIDYPGLIGRIARTFDYEACLFSIKFTDPDPSAELPLWMSRSPFHVWSPGQPQPDTPWEARIDTLMEEQMLATEPVARETLFDEIQSLVVEHLPVIDLVVPHALLGVTSRVGNLRPTPFWDPAWNSEELYLRPGTKEKSE
ncbi:MAG: ABC transporter substrate-binding protein [Vicinamibacteria bacterium]